MEQGRAHLHRVAGLHVRSGDDAAKVGRLDGNGRRQRSVDDRVIRPAGQAYVVSAFDCSIHRMYSSAHAAVPRRCWWAVVPGGTSCERGYNAVDAARTLRNRVAVVKKTRTGDVDLIQLAPARSQAAAAAPGRRVLTLSETGSAAGRRRASPSRQEATDRRAAERTKADPRRHGDGQAGHGLGHVTGQHKRRASALTR